MIANLLSFLGPVAFYLAIVVLFFAPLVYVVAINLFKINKRKVVKAMLSVFLILLLLFIAGTFAHKELRTITNNHAALLIEKIDDFKEDKGYYPKNLNELIPGYFKEIPKTGFEEEFVYYDSLSVPSCKTGLHEAYTIKYYPGMFIVATYTSDTKQWSYED